MTDEEWSGFVETDNLPERPDWVNIYLTDENGNAFPEGRELPGIIYVSNNNPENDKTNIKLVITYPNPTKGNAKMWFKLESKSLVAINLFDNQGRFIKNLSNKTYDYGMHSINIFMEELSNGIYFCNVSTNQYSRVQKIVKIN